MVLKGCVRCGGDLYREDGIGESDMVCIQCGHREAVAAVQRRRANAAAARAQGRPPFEFSAPR